MTRPDPMLRHNQIKARAARAAINRSSDNFTTEYGKWLDEHDREVAKRTLEEAANTYPHMLRDMVSRGSVRDWLLKRAAEM